MKKKGKRVSRLVNADDKLVEAGFMVSLKDRETLREEAFRKKTSQSSIMRRVLKDHFKDEEQRRKDLGVKLEAILDSCVGWLGGFEIDGENGFVERMYNAGLRLDELNDDQWERVKKSLQIGYEGYGQRIFTNKPSDREFVGKFLKLNPSKKQRIWMGSGESLEEEFEEEDSEEIKEELRRDEEYKQKHGIVEEGEGEDLEGEGEEGEGDLDEEGDLEGEGEGEEGEEEEEEIQIELVEE